MKAAALQQNQHHLNPRTRKLVTYTLFALIPLALLHYYLLVPYPIPIPASTSPSHSQSQIHTTLNPSSSSGVLSHDEHDAVLQPPLKELENVQNQTLPQCDYSSGQWIPDDRGPLYNGTSCHTIKENQNCMAHGRPDTGYLYWRWRPYGCSLPQFDPSSFLQIIRNRHVAFIGDSMARNQAESLMCLLATGSRPELVYRDSAENRYRRWIFRSHNATFSIYWSPFLVKRIEKSEKTGIRHNRVFLDAFDERWINDFESMDVILFSLGHWFLIPGIYYENDQIIGCHVCPEFNHTEIGFFEVFQKAVRSTLDEVRRRHVEGGDGQRERLVAVMTFTQAHFEGDWDKAGSCAKTQPYKEGEVEMEYTTGRMRRTVLDELERMGAHGSRVNGLHFQAVDVTQLAMLRPDGHPGPYMYPDPFGNGKTGDRVQNDCVHWCMPGPVDTFNEILWQLVAQTALFS
ncbi:hypothetical protein LUZ61_004310 [Rhynchospora tenuis]|uniref:Trichome birefringence-like N-terminal domain-containing protein n=1 Tax=Rhynchospora tenuis TaxID=198213 RepID=A0AAD5ZMM0_9POAL|nr:hypothetical protein LUZ61_004310 [Rhynchospora tenuis]